jgi:hypothetical protein
VTATGCLARLRFAFFGLPFSDLEANEKVIKPSVENLLVPLFHSWRLTKGKGESLKSNEFALAEMDDGLTVIELESHLIGRIPANQVPKVLERVTEVLSRVTDTEDYQAFQRLLAEREELTGVLQDELAVITFRRVVPGRCRYCPI